jgi:hypothetical protein
MEDPTQLCLANPADNIAVIVDQHWVHGRLQRHQLKLNHVSTDNVHHLDHLRDPAQDPGSAPATASLESRPLWSGDQYSLDRISRPHLHLCALPDIDAGHIADHELELSYRWRNGNHCYRLLLCGWKEKLCPSGGFGASRPLIVMAGLRWPWLGKVVAAWNHSYVKLT